MTLLGVQSAFAPAGMQAARIARLGWILTIIAAVVYVIVMIALAFAVRTGRRRRGAPIDAPPADEDPATEEAKERAMRRWVKTGAIITAAILVAFVFASVATGNAIAHIPGSSPLRINIEGHQWWWGVEYIDPVAQNRITTANEIHVPVGRPVLLKLTSRDVIHSFWAPNLNGKHDLIPGHETVTWFRADTAGVYRGQCAEFCGHQHANMSFYIVAEPKEKFDLWVYAQRKAASEPVDSLAKVGKAIFIGAPCALCHNVTGTPASGTVGPDLTHVGSRMTIAAGTLPNTRGNMAAWILDPQSIKPGAKMPPNQLQPAALQALLAYMESLK